MSMPKASVYKDDSFVFRQDNIRLPRQITDIYAITESPCKKSLT